MCWSKIRNIVHCDAPAYPGREIRRLPAEFRELRKTVDDLVQVVR